MSHLAYIARDPVGGFLEDTVFKLNDRKFVLGVPESVVQDARNMGIQDLSMFTENVSPSYYGCEDTAELEEKVGIEGFAEMIKISTLAVSTGLIKKIQSVENDGGNMPHNGLKYGVSTVVKGASSDGAERMKLTIGLHDTTYLTFLIMNNVYANLRKINHPEVDDNRLRLMPRPDPTHNFAVLFNSLGINTSVLINGPSPTTRSYIFATRSDTGQLSVAMNEGLHPSTDIEGMKSFTLASLYERGMEEELGLKDVAQYHRAQPRVRELFIWKDKGQPAIHTVTDLDMTFDELKERHGMAKDHDESLGFLSRPFNPLGLGIAKEEGTKIVTYVPELLDNLVQDMHHDM